MIWGLIFITLYVVRKFKTDHPILDGDSESDNNIADEESLSPG